MPKCRRDDCRLPAVDHNVKTEGFKRKQLCPVHYEAYKKQQRAYLRVRQTLRDCEECGDKLTKTENDRGQTICAHCNQQAEEDELLAYQAEQKQQAGLTKTRELDNCETVDELKQWIRKYTL